MDHKIFTGVILLILFLSVGGVSAFDFNDLIGGSNDDKVTIEGIDFNIPDGYQEDEEEAINGMVNETNGLEVTTWSKTFSIDDDNFFGISVASYDGVEANDSVAEFIGGDEKTVNGVHGYDYNFGPLYGFTYAQDGKLVIILSTEDNLFEDIIIN